MSTKRIIKKIEKENQVTAKQVRNDIRQAIQMAMLSPSSQSRAIWDKLAPDGKEPSVDEVIKFCVRQIKERNPNGT